MATNYEKLHNEEVELKAMNGMACLVMNVAAVLVFIAVFVIGVVLIEADGVSVLAVLMIVIGALYGFVVGPMIFVGLKVLKPNEAYVLKIGRASCRERV